MLVHGQDSITVRLLQDFSLSLSSTISHVESNYRQLAGEPGPVKFAVPESSTVELEAQIFVASILNGNRDAVLERPSINLIPAAKSRSLLFTDIDDASHAFRTSSPLSIRWLARNFIPKLARVAFQESAKAGI